MAQTVNDHPDLKQFGLKFAISHWGKCTWTFNHGYSYHPQCNLDYLKDLLYVQRYLLPCAICCSHMQNYVKNHNIEDIPTLRDMRLWLIDFHNNVNRETNKPEPLEEHVSATVDISNSGIIGNWWDMFIAVSLGVGFPEGVSQLKRFVYTSSYVFRDIGEVALSGDLTNLHAQEISSVDGWVQAVVALKSCPYKTKFDLLETFITPSKLGKFSLLAAEVKELKELFQLRVTGFLRTKARLMKEINEVGSLKNTETIVDQLPVEINIGDDHDDTSDRTKTNSRNRTILIISIMAVLAIILVVLLYVINRRKDTET